MPVLCQEYMLFFCLPLSSQPRLRLLRPLSISQHTKRTREGRGAEDGHIFLTCLQLVGTWVKNIFRNLVPDFLTCPQLVGTWVKNIFRNLVPDFWRVMLFLACHVLNVVCHGVSISIVSISSVSCRVIYLRVGVSVPCRGHPEFAIPAYKEMK